MKNNLIIVESPTKVKTIKKFLGKNYNVIACQGHIKDLPKSKLGIDIDKDFEPNYITIRGKGNIIQSLKKEAKKADMIYLATDPDREGEAISWHIYNVLGLNDKNSSRITFNEITKNAVKKSIENSGKINYDLVDAQQARRLLDRLVGYMISPILWKKVKRGLSAGRVQSAALSLICDREDKIDAFIPQEYWSIDINLKIDGKAKQLITASLSQIDNKKASIENEEQKDNIIKELKKLSYNIKDIKQGERLRKPPLPFTTSTMQQEASKLLNFSSSKTMKIAQSLYEGVEIKGKGSIGLITYLRTDSTRISSEAVEEANDFIAANFGNEYKSSNTNKKSDKKIQDAHEAIRPTNIKLDPVIIKDSLSRDQFRLYQLIWKRFLASMMSNAVYDTISISIVAGKYLFKASTSNIKFAGYLSIYEDVERTKYDKKLANLSKDTKLDLDDILPNQHFTAPLPHYTESSLIKELEENGIGRPSTYAPTITTLLNRRYIIKENKNLYVSELGVVINDIMKKSFPQIVDISFTARMEERLDSIAYGDLYWKEAIRNFYPEFKKAIDKAEDELANIKIEDEVSDVVCDKCGSMMVIKYGPHGKFLACPNFPECRNTKTYYEKIGVKCPKCGNDIVHRKTKKGRSFYGCMNYPDCDFSSWSKPVDKKCPNCGKLLVQKGSNLVCIDNCGYKEKIKKNDEN